MHSVKEGRNAYMKRPDVNLDVVALALFPGCATERNREITLFVVHRDQIGKVVVV